MYTVLAGGALALAWLTPFRRLMPAAPQIRPSAEPGAEAARLRSRLHQPTPYGAAIAAGGLYVAALRAFN
jgi:Flp pilus assembly protein protease CpaA